MASFLVLTPFLDFFFQSFSLLKHDIKRFERSTRRSDCRLQIRNRFLQFFKQRFVTGSYFGPSIMSLSLNP
jgi:hypothetical protein